MNLENVKKYLWLLDIIAAVLGMVLVFIPIIHHSEPSMSSDYYLLGYKIDHYPIGDQTTYYEAITLTYRIGMTSLIIILIGTIILLINSIPFSIVKIERWSKAWVVPIFWLIGGLLMISGILYYYLGMNSIDSSFWDYWTFSGGILTLIGGSLAVLSTIFRAIVSLIISRRSKV
ncbi:MAG: hypothetical protein ACFFBZ_12365 [Promethearchaeota archaeon]